MIKRSLSVLLQGGSTCLELTRITSSFSFQVWLLQVPYEYFKVRRNIWICLKRNVYSISDDGGEITLNMGVASSSGYIRKVVIHQQEGGKMYIECYSAFGGINGNIGAKTVYTLPLDEETTTIGIYRNTNAYEEVLKKDSDGVWQRVQ